MALRCHRCRAVVTASPVATVKSRHERGGDVADRVEAQDRHDADRHFLVEIGSMALWRIGANRANGVSLSLQVTAELFRQQFRSTAI
jgi:hypothetical protein